MAASVTVHHSAFGSERIARLAELAGYNVHEARGRITLLWSVCTEMQTDGVLSSARVRACLGDRGDEHLIEAELGERLETGDIRVKGCTGRIEWFGDQQDGRVAGGKARVAGATRDAKGRLQKRDNGPATQVDSSSNHLSESDQESDPEREILSGSHPSGASGSDPRGDHDREPTEAERGEAEGLVLPPNPPLRSVPLSPMAPLTGELEQSLSHVTNTRGIGTRIWERLERLRNEIAAELGVEIRPLHPMDAGTRALGMRIREASLKLDAERIEADLNHVLDVVATEARTTRSVQWLTGGIFEERPYRRALGMTLDDAAKAQQRTGGTNSNWGPRNPKPPEPPRRIKPL